MIKIDPQTWKDDLEEFREKTDRFYSGEMDKNAYKGFSGGYGSYAQRGGKAGMLRLRMPGGRLTKEKLAFVAGSIEKHQIDKVHLTTCQTIQLHNLQPEALYDIMERALDCGIVTRGGGGDFPRNAMVSPLSGVERGEYFDVMPYAEAAGEYMMSFIRAEKMPRKLKVGFSNGPANQPHATFRDLGFAARPDGTFDVYSAGGLGNNPKFGLLVAEAVEPAKILYYIRAMRELFLTYGNYENRGRARTRYMRDTLGEEGYVQAYQEKLQAVLASGENLDLSLTVPAVTKTGDGTAAEGRRVIPQKQEGLYAVEYHPIGGCPEPGKFRELYEVIQDMEAAELRIAPDETLYIINLTGKEADRVRKATEDGARSLFETSVSCIGASICQVGVQDSQKLLGECLAAVREAGIEDGALPVIHISGCPSSCGTHQTGEIGFHGGMKMIEKKPHPAFTLHVNGCDLQGKERMGEVVGVMLSDKIPSFLVALGRMVQASGLPYCEWKKDHIEDVKTLAEEYLA
ncbi:MAG: nitrite/sulfite reductase [Lachnospiraceae bacterium]|nr:nitrite/sulfite reductase [Lachnospiraceae bacterium]